MKIVLREDVDRRTHLGHRQVAHSRHRVAEPAKV